MDNADTTQLRIFFCTPPWIAHASPLIVLGSELCRRGHQILYTDPLNGYLPFPAAAEVFEMQMPPKTCSLAVPIPCGKIPSLLAVFENNFTKKLATAGFDAIKETALGFRPDLVITDNQWYIGQLIAKTCGCPWAQMLLDPLEARGITEYGSKSVTQEFRSKMVAMYLDGQRFFDPDIDQPIIDSDYLRFTLGTPELLGTSLFNEIQQNTLIVPPLFLDRPHNSTDLSLKVRLEGFTGRKIFITLGTSNSQLADFDRHAALLFKTALEVFSDDCLLVFFAKPSLAGGSLSAILETLDNYASSNVIVLDNINQTFIMPCFDLVICHGGFMTTMEALRHAIPVLVMPLAYDQFDVAAIVTKAGVGATLHPARLRPETLRAKANAAESSETRLKLEAIRNSFVREDGAELLANSIEERLRQFISNGRIHTYEETVYWN